MRFRFGVAALVLPLAAMAQYAGSEACRNCHPPRVEAQSKSGHARALHVAPPGSPGYWAFGAGAKAITYVSQADRDTYVEHGQTYYPLLKSMALTPGHTDTKGHRYRTFDPEATVLKCFRCHSTGPLNIDAGGTIRPSEAGVHCESCHGPGADHVNAKGAPGTIRNPKTLSATGLNAFCGSCHRKPPEGDWTDPWKVRHQPSYLEQSACFRKSGGALTCLTCHDPHAPLDRTPADYDKRCVSCHRTAQHRTVSIAAKTCIGCHMPQVATGAPIGFTNHWIGTYGAGKPLVPSGVLRKSLPPLPPPARTLQSPADPATLRPLYEQALANADKELPPHHPEVARRASDLGLFLAKTGNPADAETPLRQAVDIDLANDDPRLAADRENLAQMLVPNGKTQEAIALLMAAAAGPDPAVAARCFAALADLDPAHAAAHYAKAIAAQEQVQEKDHRHLATLLNNLALAVQRDNRLPEAESLFRRALALQEKELGPDHPATASTLSNLGSLLQTRGQLTEAERMDRVALRIFEQKLGPYSPELATSCTNLADLLWSKGDRPQAARLYRRAVSIDESVYGLDNPEVAADLFNLGQLLKETGERAETESVLRRALGIYERAFGPLSPQAAQVRKELVP